MKKEDKDIMSVTEVAKLLGISRTHALRKINAGDIKATKVGNSYIVLKKDLPGVYREMSSKEKKEVEKAVVPDL